MTGDLMKVIGETSGHHFALGEIVRQTSEWNGPDPDDTATFEHLDGSDFWWCNRDEVEPHEEVAEPTRPTGFITKDSGERAVFASGMQRDTEAGKPRFDLLIPLDIPYAEQFLTRVAELMGRGAEKYEDRNWEQADSKEELARMKSSAIRHFMQWICGEQDEDHAAATVFNLIAHESTSYKITQAQSGLDEGSNAA